MRQVSRNQIVGEAMRQKARILRRQLTPEEIMLWQELRDRRLEGLHFRRQQVVGPYIVDFCCLSTGIVVELDGAHHQEQQAYDAIRDEYLALKDLRVIRFSNQQVREDLSAVLTIISDACQMR